MADTSHFLLFMLNLVDEILRVCYSEICVSGDSYRGKN